VVNRRKEELSNPFFKLLAWMTGLALAIILAFSAWNYFSVAQVYSSSHEETGRALAKGIGLPLGDKLLSKDYAEAESILRRAFANRTIDLALVSDLDGKVLMGLKRLDDQDQLELIFNIKTLSIPDAIEGGVKTKAQEDSRLQVWQYLNPSSPTGWLYLELKDDIGRQILLSLKHTLVLVIGITFAILFITLFLMNRNVKQKVFIYESVIKDEFDAINKKVSQDVLTKLPNRYSLYNIIEFALNRANARDQLLAILFLDLDGFKNINDQYGHQAGDLLLIQLSERLTKLFRSQDQIIRYGGDEFVICCQNLINREELEALIDRVLLGLNVPYELSGNLVHIFASIGVTIYPVDTVSSAYELITHADEALYRAKELGKNRAHFYC
jgi:diguanylate cyclase (GGDEF)-like protein